MAPPIQSPVSVETEPTDAELLDLMAAGDRDALAIIFRRHHGTVYRFSRQMLGSRDAAEDVTQDVFVALTKNAGRFNPEVASLSTYLYGIARNLVLQRYKRSRMRVEVDIDAVDPTSPPLATSSDVADALSRAQLAAQVRLAILRLPIHYREAIVLCELNGLPYEEAAAVAGCPVGTIRSRLSRARQMVIERCRAIFGKSPHQRVEGKELRAERWLIAKNNC